MAVGRAEGNRIFAGCSCNRAESGADVGVQHSKLELHVGNAGIRLPCRFFGIIS